MKNMLIREIELRDFKHIYLLNKELGYEYELENVSGRIKHILENTKDIILVAEYNDEVIGYIHGTPYESLRFDSLINLLGFVVKERYRNNGVGNILIESLESQIKKKGFSGIRLLSGYNRVNAHRFYENHGYTNNKVQKKFIKIF
ncbi:GNAT family N-acetyltransferase [Clostridium sp.]|uniref:GNAT family N-acetyltransferase n=1 Tax=Clostridium sp. TaxID=1506 RepID=UPI0032174480